MIVGLVSVRRLGLTRLAPVVAFLRLKSRSGATFAKHPMEADAVTVATVASAPHRGGFGTNFC